MNAPSPTESTAIAVAARQQFDLTPTNFQEALQFADYLASSELVPKNYRGRPADCFVALAWGMEVGLKPIQSLNSIATINGKPGVFGDAGKALLLAAGCIIDEDDGEIVKSKKRARCKITRPGRPPVERTFSLEDATTANLWNKEGPWRNYPWRQMAWRAFWFAARDAAADLLRGMGGAEELQDHPSEPRDMGAADVVQPTGTPTPAATTATATPEWSDAELAKREVKIAEFYSRGKTAADIIAFYSTKGVLSEAQKKRINDLKPKAEDASTDTAAPAADQAQDVTPKLTFASVASKMQAAISRDELDSAASLIEVIASEQQRSELSEIYERRKEELA